MGCEVSERGFHCHMGRDPAVGGRICFYFFFQSLGQLQDELALARPLSSTVHSTQVQENLLEAASYARVCLNSEFPWGRGALGRRSTSSWPSELAAAGFHADHTDSNQFPSSLGIATIHLSPPFISAAD